MRLTCVCAALFTFLLVNSCVGITPVTQDPIEGETLRYLALRPGRPCGVQTAADRTPAARCAPPARTLLSAPEDLGGLDVDAERRAHRWTQAPALTVLMTVMQYRVDASAGYTATADQLTDEEAYSLTRDLTTGLAMFAERHSQFASVRREYVQAGSALPLFRRGEIVVGRFRDVRALTQTIGLGGRSMRADGTITSGAIILDDDFDRTSTQRQVVRVHELGHSLGYGHVTSVQSVMNPEIETAPPVAAVLH